MDAVDQIILTLGVVAVCAALMKKRPRREWTRPWILRRARLGAYHALLKEVHIEDPRAFRNFVRMDEQTFDHLLHLIRPAIEKKTTRMRAPIPAEERLALCLRFLASGDNYGTLEMLYRIPRNTICRIIPETCEAIYQVLRSTYLQMPTTRERWTELGADFERRWNIPHCVGAVGGKFVALKKPAGSGSEYSNDKQFHSLTLFAVADANYNLIYVDVNRDGRVGDGRAFVKSSLFSALESNQVNLPAPSPLSDRLLPVPYFLVGDDAFPLKPYLMKPYPSKALSPDKRIFNYRLSRAQRIIENVFGIMTSRFGVLQKPLYVNPSTAVKIVLACCALHNYLRATTSHAVYTPQSTLNHENLVTGHFRPGELSQPMGSGLLPIADNYQGRSTAEAHSARDEICDFCNTNGAVPWQWDCASVRY